MIDEEKFLIYYKCRGIRDHTVYDDGSGEWLSKEISDKEFYILGEIDENLGYIKTGMYSDELVKEFQTKVDNLKPHLSEQVYEYLLTGTGPVIEEPKTRSFLDKVRSLFSKKTETNTQQNLGKE